MCVDVCIYVLDEFVAFDMCNKQEEKFSPFELVIYIYIFYH